MKWGLCVLTTVTCWHLAGALEQCWTNATFTHSGGQIKCRFFFFFIKGQCAFLTISSTKSRWCLQEVLATSGLQEGVSVTVSWPDNGRPRTSHRGILGISSPVPPAGVAPGGALATVVTAGPWSLLQNSSGGFGEKKAGVKILHRPLRTSQPFCCLPCWPPWGYPS